MKCTIEKYDSNNFGFKGRKTKFYDVVLKDKKGKIKKRITTTSKREANKIVKKVC